MVRLGRLFAALAVTFALGVAPAQAQTAYPEPSGKNHRPDRPRRQLRPGRARISPTRCRSGPGRAFFVENKPGAGTVVGTQAAAQSEPDGYTLVVGGLSNMAFNSALYSKLAYDPLRDFVPVALVYRFGYVMVGRKDLPQASLQEIVAAAKAKPGLDHGGDRRRRHRPATGGRRVHEGRRHQAAGSALQGLAAGVHRSAGRPHRPVLRFHRGRAALCAVGAGEGHRRAVVEAQPAGA